MKKGFTLIEVIVTVTIVAIIMLPIAATVIEYIRGGIMGDSIATATNLAKREISIINNLSFSDSTLNAGYDQVASPYLAGYNFDLRRTVSAVTDASGRTGSAGSKRGSSRRVCSSKRDGKEFRF